MTPSPGSPPIDNTLAEIPNELLNLVLDNLVTTRCYAAATLPSPGTAALKRVASVKEVGALLLSAKSLNGVIASLPSFEALRLARLLGEPQQRASAQGPLEGSSLPGVVAWVRALDLRDLPLSAAQEGISVCDQQQSATNYEGAPPLLPPAAPLPLHHFTGLLSLTLPRWFADRHTPALSGLRNLRVLSLQGAKVTDSGLAPLAGLERLQELDLGQCQGLLGPGLVFLAPLRHLRCLDLSFCELVSDACGPALGCLRRLEELSLSGTLVSDETLFCLGGLLLLRKLRLDFCDLVSNEGLEAIGRLFARNVERIAAQQRWGAWNEGFLHLTAIGCLS